VKNGRIWAPRGSKGRVFDALQDDNKTAEIGTEMVKIQVKNAKKWCKYEKNWPWSQIKATNHSGGSVIRKRGYRAFRIIQDQGNCQRNE
jgi:hypothetical protein